MKVFAKSVTATILGTRIAAEREQILAGSVPKRLACRKSR